MSRPAAAIVPAAGRSSRFGGMKLVADLNGEPLLNHTLRCLLDSGTHRVVVVVSPQAALDAVSLLRDARVTTVVNHDTSRGMFSSIQTGLAVADGDPILVLPADMPFVKTETVTTILEEGYRTQRVVVPVYRTKRGHPLALPARLRTPLLAVDPTLSLKEAILAIGESGLEIGVDDPGVIRDVDVRADLSD